MIQTIQKNILPASAVLMITGLVIVLWLPFGLNSTVGGLEEWAILDMLQKGQTPFFTPNYNPTRPINYASYGVTTLLMFDDVFTGYSLVLIGLFIGKALVVYALLRRLIPRNPAIALVTAALFIIYPADLGLFTFRALPNHVTVFAGLVSIFLLIYYWRKPVILVWTVIWAAQLICLLTYELLYPVLFASPLLLLWMDKRLTWRFWRITLLWSIIPAILFAWLIWNIISANAATYIGARLAEADTLATTSITAILNRIPMLYAQHVREWLFTVTDLVGTSPHLPVAFLAGLLAGIITWKFARWSYFDKHSSTLILAGAGLVLILLGYAAYLPSAYGNVHWRMYFFSSLGGAFFVSVIICWLTRRSAILAGCLSGILVTLAMIYSLHQHSMVADSSIYLQRMLGSIVQQAPHIGPNAVVVLLDDEAAIAQSDWRMSGYDNALQGALSYIYDDPVVAIFCTEADILSDPVGRRLCRWQAGGVYRLFGGREFLYPYDRLVVFQTRAGGESEMLTTLSPDITNFPSAVNYNPEPLINRYAPLPARVSTFFACWPLETCFPLNAPPQDHIRLDFDRMVRGIGWQGATPELRQLWMVSKRSTIIINPSAGKSLEIQFGLSESLGEDILESLTLEVNKQTIEIQPVDSTASIFRGVIPRAALQEETELAFTVNRVVGEYNLSLQFDWLEIRPMSG